MSLGFGLKVYADTTNANLFCSGHAFLPDGRLLVAGGHLADSHALNQATIYDSVANAWTPTAVMNDGRWYPTAIALSSGSVLVLSGSYFDLTQNQVVNNLIPQVWSDGNFTSIASMGAAFDLFPRMHVASTGIVYMTSLVQNLVPGRLRRGYVDPAPYRPPAQRAVRLCPVGSVRRGQGSFRRRRQPADRERGDHRSEPGATCLGSNQSHELPPSAAQRHYPPGRDGAGNRRYTRRRGTRYRGSVQRSRPGPASAHRGAVGPEDRAVDDAGGGKHRPLLPLHRGAASGRDGAQRGAAASSS